MKSFTQVIPNSLLCSRVLLKKSTLLSGLLFLFTSLKAQQNTSYNQNSAAIAGSFNVGLGYKTLFSNISGVRNTATGYNALYFNTGSRNTAVGHFTLNSNTSGTDNTAIGDYALKINDVGSFNTAIGKSALYFNTTGSNNTALGHNAGVTLSNLTNATAIGANAKVNISNALVLGSPGINVGIGTSAPAQELHIVNAAANADVRLHGGNDPNSYMDVFSGATVSGLFRYGIGAIQFATNATVRMRILDNGNVSIGTVTATDPDYKLFVEKGILTEKMKVALKNSGDWSDYVFANDYQLKPLSDVENFVKKNKRLPGVPSAEQLVKEGGIDVNQMFAKQMEKIEELTLYIIEMNKKIGKLEQENAKLKTTIINVQKERR